MKKWIFAFLFAVFVFLFIVLLSWILNNYVQTDIGKCFFCAGFFVLIFFGIIWFDD